MQTLFEALPRVCSLHPSPLPYNLYSGKGVNVFLFLLSRPGCKVLFYVLKQDSTYSRVEYLYSVNMVGVRYMYMHVSVHNDPLQVNIFLFHHYHYNIILRITSNSLALLYFWVLSHYKYEAAEGT